MKSLDARLDMILDKITSDDFLSGKSVAGEIPFWVFDYPPEAEIQAREQIAFLLSQIPKKRRGLKVQHINLLQLIRDMLVSRNLLDKAETMFHAKGADAVLKNLAKPLGAEKVARALRDQVPQDASMVVISGVGSAYPLVRMHNLLNAMHPLMGNTPSVFFYPGRYDRQTLSLFGDLADNPYYRAFRLAD